MIKLIRPTCPNPTSLTKGNYKHPENKSALKKASSEKCMYCESKVSHIDHAHIEHIKPKAEGKYPELKFVWDNLGYSCAICNGQKGDKYSELTPYINPYDENPEDHFVFYGWFLYPRKGSERGELTIKDIALNRAELIEQRKEIIEKVQLAIESCFKTNNPDLKKAALNSIAEYASSNKEYSLAIKFILRAQEIAV
jgi:uncharacterized protein (TIGR02646 family)